MLNQDQIKAIKAKMKNSKKVGVDKMKIYLMNEKNTNTGKYFTDTEARRIAESICKKEEQFEEIKREKI